MMKPSEQESLKTIVREALRAAVRKEPYTPPLPTAEQPGLLEKAGCFVTYKIDGDLRGCLGCFESEEPLYTTVAHYAAWSATEDPRFTQNRLKENDLPEVEFDISVLSPLMPCPHPESIRLGVDGIYIRAVGRSGCFLPQVATEQDWTVEEFWGYCCLHKAGLPYDAWKSATVTRLTFTASVIEGRYRE